MIVLSPTVSTAQNFTALKADIARYLHRDDLTADIPGFITLAESMLFREIQVKDLQTSVTGTTTGGYATLPSDFGSVSRVSISYAGAARTLDYISLADAPTSVNVQPSLYSFENGSLRIWGAGDGQVYTLYYIPKLQALSDTFPTNWLTENAYELYLYASALEGAKFIRDDAEAQKLLTLVGASVESVRRFIERQGQPATGSLQIKPRI